MYVYVYGRYLFIYKSVERSICGFGILHSHKIGFVYITFKNMYTPIMPTSMPQEEKYANGVIKIAFEVTCVFSLYT